MSFKQNIENLTVRNNNYRKVLYTVKDSIQLVVMSLDPGEEIGVEVHPHISQFIRVEAGRGKAIVGNKVYYLSDGDCVIIPRRKKHNIINTSKTEKLKLYTLYTPPEHHPKTIQRNKDKD